MQKLLSNTQLLDLSNKVAIVTGGALGIGLGISQRLAEAGASVVIANRNPDDAKSAVAELTKKGLRAAAFPTDVADESQVKALVAATVARYGQIDILVNNAGIYPTVPVLSMSLEQFTQVIQTNLTGVYLCCKHVAQAMIDREQGGSIITITSIDALHPSAVGLAHYDASKHGAWGFTKNLALELASHKIRVNAVAPGGITTPGVQKQQSGAPAGIDMKKMLEAFLAKIPMHRMGEPDEIGKVVLFLASDMASYMTGSQIVVDGGALLS